MWADRADLLAEVGPVLFRSGCALGRPGPTGPTFLHFLRSKTSSLPLPHFFLFYPALRGKVGRPLSRCWTGFRPPWADLGPTSSDRSAHPQTRSHSLSHTNVGRPGRPKKVFLPIDKNRKYRESIKKVKEVKKRSAHRPRHPLEPLVERERGRADLLSEVGPRPPTPSAEPLVERGRGRADLLKRPLGNHRSGHVGGSDVLEGVTWYAESGRCGPLDASGLNAGGW